MMIKVNHTLGAGYLPCYRFSFLEFDPCRNFRKSSNSQIMLNMPFLFKVWLLRNLRPKSWKFLPAALFRCVHTGLSARTPNSVRDPGVLSAWIDGGNGGVLPLPKYGQCACIGILCDCTSDSWHVTGWERQSWTIDGVELEVESKVCDSKLDIKKYCVEFCKNVSLLIEA